MSRERGTGAEIIHNVTTGKRENSFIHETTKWQWPWNFFSSGQCSVELMKMLENFYPSVFNVQVLSFSKFI